MNIYKDALTAVQNGGRFRVDFKSRSLSVNGKCLIKKGKPTGKYKFNFCESKSTLFGVLQRIERAYAPYRCSIPGMKDSRKAYFWAPSYYKMSKDDQLLGDSRQVAQFKLEFRVLIALIKGTLYWDDEIMGTGWFWRSDNQPQLVILRSWIEQ